MYVCTCVFIQGCMCVCVHVLCMCLYMCVHTHVCIHIHVCVHIICVFNRNKCSFGIFICGFLKYFKAGKSMPPILCAEGPHRHRTVGQMSLIENTYWPLVISSFWLLRVPPSTSDIWAPWSSVTSLETMPTSAFWGRRLPSVTGSETPLLEIWKALPRLHWFCSPVQLKHQKKNETKRSLEVFSLELKIQLGP